MSRPALSTSRSLEIIELFTNFPDRSFTFSEIFKATKINNASCHAILNALTAKGYLMRSEVKKTYQLGPSLIAAGRVAQQSYPLFLLAERAARALYDEVCVPVLLSSLVGDEEANGFRSFRHSASRFWHGQLRTISKHGCPAVRPLCPQPLATYFCVNWN